MDKAPTPTEPHAEMFGFQVEAPEPEIPYACWAMGAVGGTADAGVSGV